MTRLFAIDKQGVTYIGTPGKDMSPGDNPLLLNDVISIPTANLITDGNYKERAMSFYRNEDRGKEKEIRIDGLERVTHFLE